MARLFFAALFAGTVAVAMLAYEGGRRFGEWKSRQPDPEPLQPVRTLVASILGLLAFVLGFTFGLASAHFDSRAQLVFDEAIAIGTVYRRADFLPDLERANLRRLLLNYVDLRLEVAHAGSDSDAFTRLRQLQNQIWSHAVEAGRNGSGSPWAAPLVQSLGDLIDVHGERVLSGMRSRIPREVWMVLYGMMAVSISAAGYHAGLAGARSSISALAYALVFAAVIVTMAHGDVPRSERIQTSHQALIDLRARLTAR